MPDPHIHEALASSEESSQRLSRATDAENRAYSRTLDDVSPLSGPVDDWPETLRSSLRQLLASAPAGIGLMIGSEHRWTYVNDCFVHMTGRRTPEQFIGKTIRESMPELDGQPFYSVLDEVRRTGRPYQGYEAQARLNRGPDGESDQGYFNFIYQPIRNPSGNIEGILLYAVDVTDQVAARKMVEQSHERLEAAHIASQRLAAIVESSDDAIVSKDLNGVVTSWNPCAERMFGYSAEEMIGNPITMIIPPELQHDEQRILQTIARGERIEHFETVRLSKNGQPIEVLLTISPVRDENGKIVGASKIARDITQRKRAERILHTTERLASVGRLAATVAHEINNPLEAVTNLVYLAEHSTSEETVRGFLKRAEEELSRVALLTKQTLGFYRETKGISRLKLSSIVVPLITVFSSRARNKSIEIVPQLRQDPECEAIPGEIRQLIANLLGNSIDAVAPGGKIVVRIATATERRNQGRPGVRITVADSGPGIPANVREHLFEPFFTTKQDVGTGLGLWVCKNIIEGHDGTVRLKSSTKPGRSWTVFSVFLPLQAQEHEFLAEPPRAA